MELPKYGQYWRHYKGGLYEIMGTGYDTETNDAVTIYREAGRSGPDVPLFVRPLSVFLGTTDDHELRFTKERDEY